MSKADEAIKRPEKSLAFFGISKFNNRNFNKLVLGILIVLAGFTAAAELKLAAGKQTDYAIVAPEKPNKLEQEAVAGLKHYLGEITGADFTANPATKKYRIFVGKVAPADKKPLAERERRVKSEGNNIYIYGEGNFGNAFAVYDFLEQILGCRWYSCWGDMKIPKKNKLVLDELNYSLVPSFLFASFFGGSHWFTHNLKGALDFYRRSRIHDAEEAYTSLGGLQWHVPSRIIPGGVTPYGKFKVKGLFEPNKYFKDKNYFKTNPEFFSMNKKGKRIPTKQLCYANPELRKTFTANLEFIINKEYKGGRARVWADLNDNDGDGSTCFCPECQNLVKKYNHPAGAYFDYLLELCEYFQKKYPDIKITTLAYLMTETPPPTIRKFPGNLIVEFAPLWKNFLKPYKHPSNRRPYDLMKKWVSLCKHVRLQLYPTVYLRAPGAFPLVANIQQLVDNMRTAKELKVKELYGEIGFYPTMNQGFNELRLYILSQLAQDVTRDSKALIKDFMDNYYGAAAPLMLKYYYELEACEAKETRAMNWNPDPRGCLTYLTPENLSRWEAMFDRMEQSVKNDPRRSLNVKRARYTLDEALVSVWPKVAPIKKWGLKELDKIQKRYHATVNADVDDVMSCSIAASKDTARYKKIRIKQNTRAFDYFYAIAGGAKALPAEFDRFPKENIFQTAPYHRKFKMVKEPDAAFGIAVKSKLPKSPIVFPMAFREVNETEPKYTHLNANNLLKPETIKQAPAGYNFYHIGHTPLSSDCDLLTRKFDGSGVLLGQFYDESDSKAEYDMYISLKFEAPDTVYFDRLVLVKQGK